jgi:hypothetical protein
MTTLFIVTGSLGLIVETFTSEIDALTYADMINRRLGLAVCKVSKL